MMTVILCDLSDWRLIPAWRGHLRRWQFHWLFLYLEWDRDA